MDPVQFLEKFCEHAVKLGYSLLNLIYGCLWESLSSSVKDGPLWFPIVPHKDGVFAHHLEVGPFPSDFIFPSFPGPFLRADEEFGRPREVLYFLMRLWILPVSSSSYHEPC